MWPNVIRRWIRAAGMPRERDRGENVLAIRIRYSIISVNTPGNNVIVAGVEQVVLA